MPIYGYEAVNVEAQLREPSSLLHWTRRMLAVRKGFQSFGRGTLTFLRPGNRKILAYLREYDDEVLLCVANLARTAQPVELDLARFKGRVPVELLGRTPFPPIGELPYLLTLTGHGFLWFRLAAGRGRCRHGTRSVSPRDELPVLVLFDGWSSLFRDRVVPWRISLADKVRAQLEREVLPAFVGARRWYAAKGEGDRARRARRLTSNGQHGRRSWLLALARVETGDGGTQIYFLPLTLAWEDDDEERLRALAAADDREGAPAGAGRRDRRRVRRRGIRPRAGAAPSASGKQIKTARGRDHASRRRAAFARVADCGRFARGHAAECAEQQHAS